MEILHVETIWTNLTATEWPLYQPCVSITFHVYVYHISGHIICRLAAYLLFLSILFPLFNFLSNKFPPSNLSLPGNCCSPFPPLPLGDDFLHNFGGDDFPHSFHWVAQLLCLYYMCSIFSNLSYTKGSIFRFTISLSSLSLALHMAWV